MVKLTRGSTGPRVEALQLALAGFRGTVPDGVFGPGTELQVIQFERDFMGRSTPSGVVDSRVIDALCSFQARYRLKFGALHCPCGDCGGFGNGRGRGQYRPGVPAVEAYHLCEYPGLHRMLLWAIRAAMFYVGGRFGWALVLTSGYRCAARNQQRCRMSTNHHGKAIDFDIISDSADKREDMRRCDVVRGLLTETAAGQIGWGAPNRKALEPAAIAPTWLHYDIRCYEYRYLGDRFFVQSELELDELAKLAGAVEP